MTRGALEVSLSDGTRWRFGDPHHADRPARIEIARRAAFRKIVVRGERGLAESYMDEDWDSPDVNAVWRWFVRNADHAPAREALTAESGRLGMLRLIDEGRALYWRASLRSSGPEVLSEAFLSRWLGPTRMWSTAWFSHPDLPLAEAQRANLDRVCRALRLRPGLRVLELGGGRGAFALHAAHAYGASVVSLTRDAAAALVARGRVAAAGLGDRVEILDTDYRDHAGEYDRVVSLESRESTGPYDVGALASACDRWLSAEGLVLIQYLTCSAVRRDLSEASFEFENRRVLAGGRAIPSHLPESAMATDGGFELVEHTDFSAHAASTCRKWRERLDEAAAGDGAPSARALRALRCHLAWREAEFELRRLGVAQSLFSRPENPLLAGEAS